MSRHSQLFRAMGFILLVLCVSAVIACVTSLNLDLKLVQAMTADEEHQNMELMIAYGLFVLGAVTALFQFYCGISSVRGVRGKVSYLALGIILLVMEIAYCVVSWFISSSLMITMIAALSIIASVFYLAYGKKKDDELRYEAEQDEE